ncbi:MDR family MFS transporter [Candidatus Clostridium radicumherbarum]|uniref:MDR family MFS transporter n=1 Tax=Candidatus Clostridium radicumherbarum TaxID=3381662 RepID=A0ABW8TZE4_9CLOT
MDKRRRNIVLAIMVAMFLAAFEGTVVTTAMPTIAKSLKGFEYISWIFSAYLLTSAISTPIYGKLADLYGRKHTICVGITIFIVGSSLCGLSQNMYELIAFRALQGLGAGAILTLTYTIVGDVFALSERARIQGWIGTVWGVSSLIGPFIGGFLIDFLSWHWIFFINVPFGILSIILIQKNLNENFAKLKHKIDILGTLMMTIAIISFLFGVLENSSSFFTYACFAISIATLIIFYFIEKKASEPIIPLSIFNINTSIVNLIAFLVSGILIGIQGYMPMYIQTVLGYRATISGLTMAPMSLAWFLTAFILSKAIPKFGEKMVILAATGTLILSSILLSTLNVSSSIYVLSIFMFIMGFGFGGLFNAVTLIVQSSVGYNMRGAAVAANTLVRTLGQTIAVSIFGSVLNNKIVNYFYHLGFINVDTNNLYSPVNLNKGITTMQIKTAINTGIHSIFAITIVICAVCLILIFILPKKFEEVH